MIERIQTTRVNVLDHGYVKYIDHMGDDLRVSNAARVCQEEWRGDQDLKLINHLYKERHTSPFEHVIFTFEVMAPIFVFRQWHRHRVWKFNEISARYQELPEVYYVPVMDSVGMQSKKNHQSREQDQDNENAAQIVSAVRRAQSNAFSEYHKLLEMGCPRELARAVLPVGTYSKMYATIDLHNLFRFLTLRLNPHAQYEIRVYAEAMAEIVAGFVPHCFSAWLESIDFWTPHD